MKSSFAKILSLLSKLDLLIWDMQPNSRRKLKYICYLLALSTPIILGCLFAVGIWEPLTTVFIITLVTSGVIRVKIDHELNEYNDRDWFDDSVSFFNGACYGFAIFAFIPLSAMIPLMSVSLYFNKFEPL